MDFKNKVIIVTGASSGIGLSISKKLSKLGAIVVMASRNKAKLNSYSKTINNSFVLVTDVRKYKDLDNLLYKTLKKYGKIDGIINNAGIGYDSDIENLDFKLFEDLIKIDLLAPAYLTSKIIPIMKKNGGGFIINVSSGTALMNLENMAAYSATKAALAHFSQTSRIELSRYKINVSTVFPYMTKTDFEKNTIKGKQIINDSYGSGGYNPPEADDVDLVDNMIINAIENNLEKVVAHDWMK